MASLQPKKMPMLDLKVYVRVAAAAFAISGATAFVMTLLRLLYPNLYYVEPLEGTNLIMHYLMSSIMLISSAIGCLNSCHVMNRSASENEGKNISNWLLVDSLFETTRIIYIFTMEVIVKGSGPLQIYEVMISIGQYLLDSFMYCQMILRH